MMQCYAAGVCCTLVISHYNVISNNTVDPKEYTICTILGPMTDLVSSRCETLCFSKVKHGFKLPHIQPRI